MLKVITPMAFVVPDANGVHVAAVRQLLNVIIAPIAVGAQISHAVALVKPEKSHPEKVKLWPLVAFADCKLAPVRFVALVKVIPLTIIFAEKLAITLLDLSLDPSPDKSITQSVYR